jgi:SAM-dependent methyltransferase
MSLDDRRRWEAKHTEAAGTKVPAPYPSLAWLPPVTSGRLALDLACGRGRNTSALLALGYSVVCVDIAGAALRALSSGLRRSVGETLHLVQADLDHWPFRADAFDVIVQTDFLDRRLFRTMRDSTKAGGLVLIDTFRVQSKPRETGPSRRDFLLEDGELEKTFADWEILDRARIEEPAARAAVLARKPRL